ncbi:MAG TPA: hypothetical protein VFE62_19380 [Gemmataceae bacterium]|nr:hypothetical protein [Gemmataceae bacterium]
MALVITISSQRQAAGQVGAVALPVTAAILKQAVDDMVQTANIAVNTFGKESKEWREAMFKLHDQFKATGQEFLAVDTREFTRRAVGDAGVEFRFNVDFTEAKAKAYLVAVQSALKKAQGKFLLTMTTEDARKIVADIARDLDAAVEPAVGQLSPAVINVTWRDYKTPTVGNVPAQHISFTGYALRRLNPNDFRLVVLDQAHTVRRDVTRILTIHTPYTASINLSDSGYRPGANDAADRFLALQFKGKEVGLISLQWSDRPPTPPKLVGFRASMITLSHKEAAGQVELEFYHKGVKLADSERDHTIPAIPAFRIPGRTIKVHFGAYEEWQKNHRADFTTSSLKANPDYIVGDKVVMKWALGAVPGECNINWRGQIDLFAKLDNGREVKIGATDGFWFRNNAVEDPINRRGNRWLEHEFQLPSP